MRARIFQPPKTAMQSGWANTKDWAVEFIPTHGRRADPLMGWTGGGDTQTQVKCVLRHQGRGHRLRRTRRYPIRP